MDALDSEKTAVEDALVRVKAELASRNAAYEQLTAETERRLADLMGQLSENDDDQANRFKRGMVLEKEIEQLREELDKARAEIETKSNELDELTDFATEKEQATASHISQLKVSCVSRFKLHLSLL